LKRSQKKEETPRQKVSRAQTNVLARLVAGGYVIYLMIGLINQTRADPNSAVWKYWVTGALILVAAVLVVITLVAAYKGWNAGIFKESYYSAENRTSAETVPDAEPENTNGESDGGEEPGGSGDEGDDNGGTERRRDRGDPWDDKGGGGKDPWDDKK